MRRPLVALAALFALVLAGCASLAPVGPPASPSPADAFQLNGRFAVRYGKEGGSGRIQWTHTRATDDLDVLSPIGQGIARIVRRDGVYTLTTSDGRERKATDPGALTQETLGWRLPLDGLPHWIVGRPQPGVPARDTRDANGRLAELEQAGWRIEYLAFHNDSGLPERLRVTRGDLDLRLVLEEWQPAPLAARP